MHVRDKPLTIGEKIIAIPLMPIIVCAVIIMLIACVGLGPLLKDDDEDDLLHHPL